MIQSLQNQLTTKKEEITKLTTDSHDSHVQIALLKDLVKQMDVLYQHIRTSNTTETVDLIQHWKDQHHQMTLSMQAQTKEHDALKTFHQKLIDSHRNDKTR